MVVFIEAKLDALAKADHRVSRLRTIPGVGPRLAELVVSVIPVRKWNHKFRRQEWETLHS